MQRPAAALRFPVMETSLSDTRTCQRGTRILSALLMMSAVLLGPVAAGGRADELTAEGRLAQRLDQILLSRKQAKAQFGARVIELPSGRVLYDHEGHQPLIPASNMKLVVMAASIEGLGADYEFRTYFAIRGKDLVVLGSGDPTFGDERLAAARRQSILHVYHKVAEQLTNSGVKQIPGDIIIDDFIFDQQFVHPKWPPDQHQSWYEAPVGGLNFNANCVMVRVRPTVPGQLSEAVLVPGNTYLTLDNRSTTGEKQHTVTATRATNSDTVVVKGQVARSEDVGPLTVRDPGLYFGSVLKTVLATKGIHVAGRVVRERVRTKENTLPEGCHLVWVHKAPLSDALARCGKESLGMMAEALIKLLGAQSGTAGSWENGRAAILAFCGKVGVADGQIVVDDGSGLSRENRLSPAATTQILRFMFTSPQGRFELLRDSLAVGGVDGTMSRRLTSSDVKGRVFAKTGYIKNVRTLSGYVQSRSGQWLAFAFYYNQSGNTAEIKGVQDEVCRILAAWPDIPPPPPTSASRPVGPANSRPK